MARTNKGAASILLLYTEVDLNTLEFKKPMVIPKDFVREGLAIEGFATLWFGKIAILRCYTRRLQFHGIILQKVEF